MIDEESSDDAADGFEILRERIGASAGGRAGDESEALL